MTLTHRLEFQPRFLLLIIFLGCFSISIAQQRDQSPTFYHKKSKREIKLLASPPKAATNDPAVGDTTLNFIVRLRTSPVATRSSGRIMQGSKIDQEHQDFLAKLKELNSARTSGPTGSIEVIREYKRSINGFALKASRSLAESIGKMPHVVSVSEDKRVKTNDEFTNYVINVPRVWSDVGTKGEGTVIGIIDTGIDYTHPDLGGGIGEGFKVIGGYDFVNDDSDPKDDHGHGTHVAGIAAANGVIKGVAPDAKLVAVKVLAQDGYGWDSEIIAGIEYVVDPDGDPATDDKLDVASMSLGRLSDGTVDPMAEAVNNAVLQGVCFVIAAGNDYEYFKIGTPGISENAITVGAIENSGATADFSSRGPVAGTFALKPDVGAPGVIVKSTYLNSEYIALSGTSMATPHISGVVALLLSKHPGWTPADVKAALMNTANFDGNRVVDIGAGTVDAFKAITTDLIMSPGSISYGKPQSSEEVFRRSDIITVSNKSSEAHDVSLAVELVAGASFNIQLTPPQFSLAPGEIKDVRVDMELDLSTLQTQALPHGQFANIVLNSNGKQCRTLLNLFNPPVTTLDFNHKIPWQVVAFQPDGDYSTRAYPTTHQIELMMPAGKYDIFANVGTDTLLVVEDIEITSKSKSIVIDSETGKNRVTMKPVDVDGNPLPYSPLGISGLLGEHYMIMWLGPLPTFSFSDLTGYTFLTRQFFAPENSADVYEIALSTKGDVKSNIELKNDPALFVPMKITNPSAPEGKLQNFRYLAWLYSLGTWNIEPVRVPNPANVQVYEDINDAESVYGFYPSGNDAGFYWETARRRFDVDRGIAFNDNWQSPIRSVPRQPFDFRMGKSLVNFTAFMRNSANHIILSDEGRLGVFNHAYGERAAGDVKWWLTRDTEIISSGTFRNSTQYDFSSPTYKIEKDVMQGPHQLTLKWDSYYVGGRFSDVTAQVDINMTTNGRWDNTPPMIREFDLVSEGVSTNSLEEGKDASINVNIYEYNSPETRLELSAFGTETWDELQLIPSSNGRKTASVSGDLPTGLYSLRLTSSDFDGNRVIYTLNPAFSVGPQAASTPFTKVALISPRNLDVNAGVNPAFTWTNLSDATYTFQLSRDDQFEELVINETVDAAMLSLSSPLDEDLQYYWRVKASINDVDLPWSDPFSFNSSTFLPATLLSPTNGSIEIPTYPTTFTWNPPMNSFGQRLELSSDANFNDIIFYQSMTSSRSDFDVYFLEEGKTYYWRIRSFYFSFLYTYEILSEVNSFTTVKPVIPDPPDDDDPPVVDPPDDADPPVVDPPDDDEPPVVTGLEDSMDEVLPFPNPFTDRVYIKMNSRGNDVATVVLFDNLGRQVRLLHYNLAKGENVLTIDSEPIKHGDVALTQGMYVAHIKTGLQKPFRLKLLRK